MAWKHLGRTWGGQRGRVAKSSVTRCPPVTRCLAPSGTSAAPWPSFLALESREPYLRRRLPGGSGSGGEPSMAGWRHIGRARSGASTVGQGGGDEVGNEVFGTSVTRCGTSGPAPRTASSGSCCPRERRAPRGQGRGGRPAEGGPLGAAPFAPRGGVLTLERASPTGPARDVPQEARLRGHARSQHPRRSRRHLPGSSGSWCTSTMPPGSTTTCAWRSTACSPAGPAPRARATTPHRSGSRWRPRTTRSPTATSRAASRTASTAPATASSGTAARTTPSRRARCRPSARRATCTSSSTARS